MTTSPLPRRLAALAVLLIVAEALLAGAGARRGPLTFDVGPSTPAYLDGFDASEERPPVTSRWAHDRATIALPLDAAPGEATLVLRCARFLDRSVRVQAFAAGTPLGAFDVHPGRFRVLRLPVRLPGGPLRLEFASDGPNDLAFALDWVRVEGARWRLPWRLVAPRALVAGVFALALLAGFGLLPALGAGLVAALVEAAWLATDPFALAHVLTRITLPALMLGLLAALLARGRPGGRALVLIFLASFVAKGATVFHPSYFYNDVRNNRRFVEALRDDPGTLGERRQAAQVRIGVAYPRLVAGKKYAFPYSPVFFMPFGLAGHDAVDVEEAMKHAVVAASAAEAVIVFFLAGLVFGGESTAGALAALVAALLPVFTSRLTLALWSTLGGHLFDSLALLAAVAWARRPQSRRCFAATAAAVQASYLTYVASLFNMALFTGGVALLVRRLRMRMLAIGVVAALVTVGLLYFDFSVLFVREILPAYVRAGAGPPVTAPVPHGPGDARAEAAPGNAGETESASPATPPDDGVPAPGRLAMLGAALRRIPIFYGWLLPALALAGLSVARRRVDPDVVRVLAAWLLAFALLVALRGVAGGLFKDMKEIEFVAPLVALLAGGALAELGARGRAARGATAALTVAVAVWAVATSYGFFETWTRLADLP